MMSWSLVKVTVQTRQDPEREGGRVTPSLGFPPLLAPESQIWITGGLGPGAPTKSTENLQSTHGGARGSGKPRGASICGDPGLLDSHHGDWGRQEKGTEREGAASSARRRPLGRGAVASRGRQRACVRRDSGSELRETERERDRDRQRRGAVRGQAESQAEGGRGHAKRPGQARASGAGRVSRAEEGEGQRVRGCMGRPGSPGQARAGHLPQPRAHPVSPGVRVGGGVSRSRSGPWRAPVSAAPPSQLGGHKRRVSARTHSGPLMQRSIVPLAVPKPALTFGQQLLGRGRQRPERGHAEAGGQGLGRGAEQATVLLPRPEAFPPGGRSAEHLVLPLHQEHAKAQGHVGRATPNSCLG